METQNTIEIRAYTVPQFCDAYGIGKSLLYKLVKANKGPRLTKIGTRTLIAADEAERWFKSQ